MTSQSYESDGALDTLRHAGLVSGVDAVWSFDYNLANQVTGRSVSDARFLWRPAAAMAEGYVVNGLNQYTQVSPGGVPFALAYDGNGSLTGDGVWSYGYDKDESCQ